MYRAHQLNLGYKYYVVFVDHFTKLWLDFLNRKSKVCDFFIRFKGIVENFFNNPILQLYTDNGGKYIALIEFLAQHGISHLTTLPHTSEHNGYSERCHSYILQTSLIMLQHTLMPLSFWPHVFTTLVYLINKMSKIKNLAYVSSFEKLFGKCPNLEKLKTFF